MNAGSIPTAIDALEQAMRLGNGGDGQEWFLLSSAYSLKGDRVQARRWFDKAAQWLATHRPDDPALRALRAKAAQLLGESP